VAADRVFVERVTLRASRAFKYVSMAELKQQRCDMSLAGSEAAPFSSAPAVHVVTPEKASEDDMCLDGDSCAPKKTAIVDKEAQTTESAVLEQRLCVYAAGNQGREKINELATLLAPRQLPAHTRSAPLALAAVVGDPPGLAVLASGGDNRCGPNTTAQSLLSTTTTVLTGSSLRSFSSPVTFLRQPLEVKVAVLRDEWLLERCLAECLQPSIIFGGGEEENEEEDGTRRTPRIRTVSAETLLAEGVSQLSLGMALVQLFRLRPGCLSVSRRLREFRLVRYPKLWHDADEMEGFLKVMTVSRVINCLYGSTSGSSSVRTSMRVVRRLSMTCWIFRTSEPGVADRARTRNCAFASTRASMITVYAYPCVALCASSNTTHTTFLGSRRCLARSF